MNTTPRLIQEWPQRVPLKIIGRGDQMDAEAMVALVQEHLGPQPEADRAPTVNQKGAFQCFTFWVILPHEQAEGPLRAALQAMAGVVMQL